MEEDTQDGGMLKRGLFRGDCLFCGGTPRGASKEDVGAWVL